MHIVMLIMVFILIASAQLASWLQHQMLRVRRLDFWSLEFYQLDQIVLDKNRKNGTTTPARTGDL